MIDDKIIEKVARFRMSRRKSWDRPRPSVFLPPRNAFFELTRWRSSLKMEGTLPWLIFTASIDDVWRLRDKEQDERNEKRAKHFSERMRCV